MRASCRGWWSEHPVETAAVFVLNVEQAAFASWNLKQGQMTVRRWSSERGYTKKTRQYP